MRTLNIPTFYKNQFLLTDLQQLALDLPLNPEAFLHTASELSPQKSTTRRSYPLEFKLQIVELAKQPNNSNRGIGRMFGIADTAIRKWRKNEDKIREAIANNQNRTRLPGGGQKARNEDLEKELYDWMVLRQSSNLKVTWKIIQEKARELSKDPTFAASDGWCTRFLKRYSLPISNLLCNGCESQNVMATHSCSECDENLCDNCVKAHQRVKFTKDHTISPLGS